MANMNKVVGTTANIILLYQPINDSGQLKDLVYASVFK